MEKEDEFDVNEESNKIRTLTLNEFDNLKTNYADFIYPASNKMLIDGNISASWLSNKIIKYELNHKIVSFLFVWELFIDLYLFVWIASSF